MLSAVDISGGQVSGVDNLSSAASSVVNWEADESGIIKPRPGLATLPTNAFSTSVVIGVQRWKGYLVLVTEDRNLWAIKDTVPDAVFALSDSTTATQLEGSERPVFAVGELYVYVTGGRRIQRWAPPMVTSEVIAASPLCTHIAILGQRLITNIVNDVTNQNTFQWSDIGEGAWGTWPAANVATADARPDPIVGLTENTNELAVWGTETMQMFAVGSDPTFPYETTATLNVGLAAPYAFIRMDSDYAFLDHRRRILFGDGRSIDPISDAIQRDINGFSTIDDCWMFREERGQQSALVVRFPTERRTFVYDLKGKRWSERDYYLGGLHVDWPVSSHVYWPAQNQHVFGSSLTSAGLMTLDASSRSDIGGPLVSERTTGWHDHGTPGMKRSARLRLVMKRGTAAEGATPGSLEIRVQNDDGPWGVWKQVSLGTPSQYQQERFLFGGGIFKRRRYGIRYSSTDDTSLVSLHDEVYALEQEEAA